MAEYIKTIPLLQKFETCLIEYYIPMLSLLLYLRNTIKENKKRS